MKKHSILLLTLICMVLPILCGCYDYTNWKKVEIPTQSEYKGTIKIPNHYEFVDEDGIISLIDTDTNEILAEQVYQEWRMNGHIGDTSINNWDELEFKSNIKDLDVKKQDYYSLEKGYSNAVYMYIYDDGINKRYCLQFSIYADDAPIHLGDFDLSLIFKDNIEYELIDKMALSYRWGGFIYTH